MTKGSPVSLASMPVISSVSLALRDIIVRGIGDEFGLTPGDVVLSAPGAEEAPHNETRVSLCVYHLRPKSPHVGTPPITRGLDGTWTLSHEADADLPPSLLELCYMVVPSTSDVRNEQKLTTALAKLFHAFSTIHVAGLPDSDARSDLLESGNARLKLVAQYPDMDVIRRLWSQPSGQHAVRSALYYRVLPVFVPAQPQPSAPRARERASPQVAE